MNLSARKKEHLNELFRLNCRVMRAYLLKDSLDRRGTFSYEGAMLRYLKNWIDEFRWQRLIVVKSPNFFARSSHAW